jgi:SAM-dependent methyltransferase
VASELHASVLNWFAGMSCEEDYAGKDVLEVGSFNVNGSVRPMVEGYDSRTYVGIDRTDGPGVDRVVDVESLTETLGVDCADVLISTEMLEHCTNWRRCVREMVEALRPGGLLLLTTRSGGFPYHCPPDNWRYTLVAMLDIFGGHAGLSVETCVDDPEAPGVFVRARKPSDWSGWLRADLGDVVGVTSTGETWWT